MTERAYTVAELDVLRRVVALRFDQGTSFNDPDAPRPPQFTTTTFGPPPPDPSIRTKWIEEQVRTHMLAGHTGADIVEADRARLVEYKRRTAENLASKAQ